MAALKNGLAVFYKTPATQPSCGPAVAPERWEQKLMHVYRNFANKTRNWNQPRSSNCGMAKHTVAHPNHGILLSNKREHHWYIHRPDWIVNKAEPGGSHTVWFYSCCCSVTRSRLTLCDPMDCIAHQAPLYVEFSRQEYWSGLPFPTPGDLPDPGMEPASPVYLLYCRWIYHH